MPQIWNNMVVVTKDELIPAFFPSLGALQKKITRDSRKSFGIRRVQSGGGSNTKILIDFDTLPHRFRAPEYLFRLRQQHFRRYCGDERAGEGGYAVLPGVSGF